MTDLKELLKYIDPSTCNYQEWVNVGMALKQEGYYASDWEEWSSRDTTPNRYHYGECYRKWESFEGSSTPVTGGTIVQMAKERGYVPPRKNGEIVNYDFDDEIEVDGALIDTAFVEEKPIIEPYNWNPVSELIEYLSTLFDQDDMVGYVVASELNGDKYVPADRGHWKKAGELIRGLESCNGDIGAVFGDYNPQAGAWIRFNPLDGQGVRNSNVAAYKYALVESDSMDIDKQNALIRELQLPVATLTHSGKKSIHAVVRIDADNYNEYKKRVNQLYSVCENNGLQIDTQNKNPSRLSRMPGFIRGNQKQFLIDTNIGQPSWNAWIDWMEEQTDDLPDFENMADVWNDLPPLAPPLIDGILRQGHKMLISGPSKAGKSFALIELAISIAEGLPWFGCQCTQGKVLYVNLEVDRSSCLHRFKDVYEAMQLTPVNISNIDVWSLRGMAVPMNKLVPMLVRRARKKGFICIIIDPIYKVITGDENSAEQMAKFCNEFDKICNQLGVSVVYCHHHSKGVQSNKKASDRASGSGVFARDPDASIDFLELKVPEEEHAEFPSMTAWKMECTLREFAKPLPKYLWFEWPIHKLDESKSLQNMKAADDKESKKKDGMDKKTKEAIEDLENFMMDREPMTSYAISKELGRSPHSVKKWCEMSKYLRENSEKKWYYFDNK